MDMEMKESGMELNERWEQRIKNSGADFVYFVDVSMLPADCAEDYSCAVLFGKTLSKEYLNTIKAGQEPKRKEVFNTEHKMDALAVKLAGWLQEEGYQSVGKLKFGRLPHKTVALRAGLGFIGKNNLLVTHQYGCAQMLGKVLTTAPFITMGKTPQQPQCGDCAVCVDVCPTKALLGKTWDVTTTRDQIMIRKNCTLCLKCMVWCPYTTDYLRKTKDTLI